jgi:hypothetical protein
MDRKSAQQPSGMNGAALEGRLDGSARTIAA